MRVLITRPKADAEELAEILRQRKIEPVLFPMLEISQRNNGAEALARYKLSDIQAVLITSANGVRALAQADQRKGFNLYCVGDASKETALELGYTSVKSADADVKGLGELVKADLKPDGGKLIHICSTHLAGDLQSLLKDSGFDCEKIVLYDSVKVETLSPAVEKDLKDGAIDAVLLYSPRTAEAFQAMVEKAGLAKCLSGITILALSQAVADKLKKAHYRDIQIAESPRQEALLNLLSPFKGDPMTDKKEETKSETPKTETKKPEDKKPEDHKAEDKKTEAKPSPFEKAAKDKDKAGDKDQKDPAKTATGKPQPTAAQAQKPAKKKGSWKLKAALVLIILIAGGAAGGYFTQDMWLPKVKGEIAKVLNLESAPNDQLEPVLAELSALRNRIDNLPAPQSQPAAQEPVDLGPLKDRLKALESGLSTIQAASGDSEKLAEFQKVVEKMEAVGSEGLEELATENQTLKDQIAKMQDRLDSLESAKQAERSASDAAQARLAALSGVRAALMTSGSFKAELAAFKAVADDSPAYQDALAVLAPLAASGVSSLSALQASYQKVANDIVRASALPEDAGWMQETVKNITSLVTIRRAPGAMEGDTALGTVARAEHMVETGDLSGALAELDSLSGPAREAAKPWMTKAQARLDAMGAVNSLQARLLGGDSMSEGM